ncbi:hypothetical protein [Sphingomonas sp. TREG-RG-20F-R18-01]|uniref:hypothetical protein n=1 Tax=Sphingomonas sp. TREG-RG-20F-R18-01 TaxID=2914982 RepID=UPI001F58F797|nr:hypothetical protein [Sphingomonas sp. TREG-RG-20F-R18-01]
MANPPDIKTFPRRVDPSMPRRGFYAVLTRGDQVLDILQTDEEVASFTITPNADATAAGMMVLTDDAFAPRYADRVFGFWIDIDPVMRDSAIFNGTGIVLGVEISFTTNFQQSDQITVGIRVVNK